MTVRSQLRKRSCSGIPRCPSLLATRMSPHQPRSPVSQPLGKDMAVAAHALCEQTGTPRGRGHHGPCMSKVDWESQGAAAMRKPTPASQRHLGLLGRGQGRSPAREEGQGV